MLIAIAEDAPKVLQWQMGRQPALGTREGIPGEGEIDLKPKGRKGQRFFSPVLSGVGAISHEANSASPKFRCTMSVIEF